MYHVKQRPWISDSWKIVPFLPKRHTQKTDVLFTVQNQRTRRRKSNIWRCDIWHQSLWAGCGHDALWHAMTFCTNLQASSLTQNDVISRKGTKETSFQKACRSKLIPLGTFHFLASIFRASSCFHFSQSWSNFDELMKHCGWSGLGNGSSLKQVPPHDGERGQRGQNMCDG